MEGKTIKILLGLLMAGVVITSSCDKGEKVAGSSQAEQSCNYVSSLGQDATGMDNYLLTVQVGHRGENCPGCMMYFGRRVHIDCQGDGNYCRVATRVCLETADDLLTATTVDTFDLTSEDFFSMPARSLNYTDEDDNRVYLNIPAQLVLRDTATLQFTFTGLYITEDPEFENN